MAETLRVTHHVVVSCHDFIADNHGGDPSQRTYNDVNRILRDAGYVMRPRREGVREEMSDFVIAESSPGCTGLYEVLSNENRRCQNIGLLK